MKKSSVSAAFYWFSLVAMAVFLYGLSAPNLILSSWEPYWRWQLWMWQTFFNNRTLLSHTFFLLTAGITVSYFWVLKTAWDNQVAIHTWVRNKPFHLLGALIIAVSPFIFGMNGLSYDLFNYAFNAKMVVVYQENPHQKVALDFPDDPWVRFMHNTHTPAPYGYGWTGLSLVPYLAGFGKLLPTWLFFKLASLFSLALLAWSYVVVVKTKKTETTWLTLVVLSNPLLLIEILMNGHNDLWMMVPAVLSMWLIGQNYQQDNRASWRVTTVSLTLLLLSISIKLATVVLLPIWLALILTPLLLSRVGSFRSFLKPLTTSLFLYWPAWSALALSCLLLMERSKLFLPWYWSWILVWLPLIPAGKVRTIATAVGVGFSLSSLLRYIPYLYSGEYGLLVVSQQITLTFFGGVILSLSIYFLNSQLFQSRRGNAHQVE